MAENTDKVAVAYVELNDYIADRGLTRKEHEKLRGLLDAIGLAISAERQEKQATITSLQKQLDEIKLSQKPSKA